MKNINQYFLSITSAVFFTIGAIFMLFSNLILWGGILLILGFITSIIVIGQKRKYFFQDNFLIVAAFLSLIIIAYTFLISYSKNIIIISTSFYALTFLIQVNGLNNNKRKKIIKRKNDLKQNEQNKQNIKNVKTIKQSIKELKEEIKPKKTYYFTNKGKAFHIAGCISLSRTKQEQIKKNNSREDLISKGYKTCKVCNS